jgi:hypothetical protein
MKKDKFFSSAHEVTLEGGLALKEISPRDGQRVWLSVLRRCPSRGLGHYEKTTR